MVKYTIEIASCPIEIIFSLKQKQSTVKSVMDYFDKFRSKRKTVKIRIIFSEKAWEIRSTIHTICLPESFSLDQIVYSILRIIRIYLRKSGFFLHCSSCVLPNGKAVLFLGSSRAGKSTISELLKGKFQKIVDDQGIVINRYNRFYIFQSLHKEKNSVMKGIKGYEIYAMFFLKKSTDLKMVKETDIEKNFVHFYKQVWVEKHYKKEQYSKILKFVNSASTFTLYFPKDRIQLERFFQSFKQG